MWVLLKAAVPLIQDNTASTTQTEQQSSLHGILQGNRSCTGEKENKDTKRVNVAYKPLPSKQSKILPRKNKNLENALGRQNRNGKFS